MTSSSGFGFNFPTSTTTSGSTSGQNLGFGTATVTNFGFNPYPTNPSNSNGFGFGSTIQKALTSTGFSLNQTAPQKSYVQVQKTGGFTFKLKEEEEKVDSDVSLFYTGFDQDFKQEPLETILEVTAQSTLKRFFKNPTLSDISIKVKDLTIPAHKFVLCARSKVWETLITGPWAEKGTKILEIDNVSPEAFETFLYHIYSFESKLPPGGFDALLEVADLAMQHDVPTLTKFIAQNVESCLNDDNVCDAIQTIRDFGNPELENACWAYFFQNYATVQETEGFLRMTIPTLEGMLRNDIMPLEESEVFELLQTYASKKKEEGRPSEILKPLIPFVRFPLMSVQDLSTLVEQSKLLDSSDLLQVILYVASSGFTGKPSFSTKPRQVGDFFNGNKIAWDLIPQSMTAINPKKVIQNKSPGTGFGSGSQTSQVFAFSSFEFNSKLNDLLITVLPNYESVMAIGLAVPSKVQEKDYNFSHNTPARVNMIVNGGSYILANHTVSTTHNVAQFMSGIPLTMRISPKTGKWKMKLAGSKDWKWTFDVTYPCHLAVYMNSNGDSLEILSVERANTRDE